MGWLWAVATAARALGVGALAGSIAGLLAGGVGSRLAMRISAIATGPSCAGLVTENGTRCGEITADGTVFLLMFGALPLRGFQRHPRLHFLAAGFLIVVGILSVLMVIMLGGADLLGGEATARDMALFPLLWYLLLAVPAFRLANGRWRIISGANTKSCWRVHPATVGRVAVVSPLLVGLVLTLQAMSDIALG